MTVVWGIVGMTVEGAYRSPTGLATIESGPALDQLWALASLHANAVIFCLRRLHFLLHLIT